MKVSAAFGEIFRLPASMFCGRCDHKDAVMVKTSNMHYGRVICENCNSFIDWASQPKKVAPADKLFAEMYPQAAKVEQNSVQIQLLYHFFEWLQSQRLHVCGLGHARGCRAYPENSGLDEFNEGGCDCQRPYAAAEQLRPGPYPELLVHDFFDIDYSAYMKETNLMLKTQQTTSRKEKENAS